MEQNNQPLYSVKQLARLAGISVRTLHVYDKKGLLKPAGRSRAGYRLYGPTQLLRLQQVPFYRELDVPLAQIGRLLDEPGFDLGSALVGHRAGLLARRERLDTLLRTIDHTLNHLKNENMNEAVLNRLFEGMPREQALDWRRDAIAQWGEDNVLNSEKMLLDLPPAELQQLKKDQRDIRTQLAALRDEDPESEAVQAQIARHYANIRGFWGLKPGDGPKAERYRGLAELYVSDGRYLGDPGLALFVREAMLHFVATRLDLRR